MPRAPAGVGKRHDAVTVKCVLAALADYLDAGRLRRDTEGGDNVYCRILEQAGALEKLKDLQEDTNEADEAVTPSAENRWFSSRLFHRHAQRSP